MPPRPVLPSWGSKRVAACSANRSEAKTAPVSAACPERARVDKDYLILKRTPARRTSGDWRRRFRSTIKLTLPLIDGDPA